MINKLQKRLLTPLLILLFLLTSGCGIFDPPNKDVNGFYTDHYSSCGPRAVHEALIRYYNLNNIPYDEQSISSKQISLHIQGNRLPFIFDRTNLLVIFDKDAAGITWPSELKSVCKKHGVSLRQVPVSELYKRDSLNKTYIILVHKKYTLSSFHWYMYPDSNTSHFWGTDTIFDIVYVLEPIE